MENQSANLQKEERFRSWVQAYANMLYSHAVLRGLDRDNAKDIIQDTFYAAWKNIDGFESRASVKNWLFVILKNKIADHYRKVAAAVTVQLSAYDTLFDEAGHWVRAAYPAQLMVRPSDATDSADLQHILDQCSEKLNSTQKAVFFMKYMDDLESEHICQQLSISPNNYWTTLHRAKVQLRACLEKNWFRIKRK